MNEKANRDQDKKKGNQPSSSSRQIPQVKSATPENAAGRINPSAPTESTEQGPRASQAASQAGRQPHVAGSQQTGHSSAAQHSQAHPDKKSFRCADAGYGQCNWQVEGSENEILPQIEQHAKDVHHVQMKPEAREQVRHLMKDAA